MIDEKELQERISKIAMHSQYSYIGVIEMIINFCKQTGGTVDDAMEYFEKCYVDKEE